MEKRKQIFFCLMIILFCNVFFACKKDDTASPTIQDPFAAETFAGTIKVDSVNTNLSGKCSSMEVQGSLRLTLKSPSASYPTLQISIRPIPTKDSTYTLAAGVYLWLTSSANFADQYVGSSGGTVTVSNFSGSKFAITFDKVVLKGIVSNDSKTVSGSFSSN